MSEDNKSEKNSDESIMDKDACDFIFNQFKSPSQNSNDDEQFIMEGSPPPEGEATGKEKNDSKNKINMDINEFSKVMNSKYSKFSKKEKKLITDNGESNNKYTTKEKKIITDNGELNTKSINTFSISKISFLLKAWAVKFTNSLIFFMYISSYFIEINKAVTPKS